MVLFDLRFVQRFVAGDVSNVLSVRPPGILLDAQRGAGDLLRFTTVHGQDEYLRGGFLFFPSFCNECQSIA